MGDHRLVAMACVAVVLIFLAVFRKPPDDSRGLQQKAGMQFVLRGPPSENIHREKSQYESGGAIDTGFPFLVIGDFGTADKTQHRVAEHLSKVAMLTKPRLVLSTGDNVYGKNDAARAAGLDGVSSVDDPNFSRMFESVYPKKPGLENVPWWLTLGNHDCAGNSDAQVQYSKRSQTWKMPSKYYSFDENVKFKHPSGGSLTARFVILDSCLLVCASAHTGTMNKRCGSVKTGTLAERDAQLDWLDRKLADLESFGYLVVSTHWSMFSLMGNGPTKALQELLLPRLKRVAEHNITVLWFNGHDHSLQSHRMPFIDSKGVSKNLHFFVSGGGGFHTHPKLKRIADGSFMDGKHHMKSTLNRGTVTNFAEASHGFVHATLIGGPRGGAVVKFYKSVPGNSDPILVHTDRININ